MVEDEVIGRFEPVQADESHAAGRAYPQLFLPEKYTRADESGNGGGFVFDCRGILNPGRIAEFKTLTGRDKAVKDFLEQQTRMPEFLNGVYNIVDISVEDYIKRGFRACRSTLAVPAVSTEAYMRPTRWPGICGINIM
jgi:hypothetical protein